MSCNSEFANVSVYEGDRTLQFSNSAQHPADRYYQQLLEALPTIAGLATADGAIANLSEWVEKDLQDLLPPEHQEQIPLQSQVGQRTMFRFTWLKQPKTGVE